MNDTYDELYPLLARAVRDDVEVEVTIRGKVGDTGTYTTTIDGAGGADCLYSRNIVGVRLVSEAEPDNGEVRFDRDGDAWQRQGDEWFIAGGTGGRSWDSLVDTYGPLTKTRG